jgi:hypothetical protein
MLAQQSARDVADEMVEMHIETAMPLQCHSLELSAMSTATFCCRGDATYFR